MKITQINAINYSQQNLSVRKNNENESPKPETQTQPNFKGLWGETTYDSYSDREYQSDSTCYHYYPFKGETKQEIESIVNKHSYYNSWAANVYDAVTQISSARVSVCEVLPFTSKDFIAYLDNKVSDLKRTIIERHILEKNLRRTL